MLSAHIQVWKDVIDRAHLTGPGSAADRRPTTKDNTPIVQCPFFNKAWINNLIYIKTWVGVDLDSTENIQSGFKYRDIYHCAVM